ncbi:hypothetical protein [Micromonospora sp. NBC_01796]|uniref:hypothetical protein n=1 Tax=Micromonospora sp. NBC_01796 TaxID=2975987 RepID=UPI002DD8D015|nr:hypothetical protein [Micromonospora sp. NBC_01796]WSA84709.1 hypothetical protein OIE47_30800 [Micromonospora sp. NBC_01796]
MFAEIVLAPLGTLRAVEIAGRGIAAEARCTLAVLADKTPSGSDAALQAGLAYADRLMELGTIEDGLVELWRSRRAEDLDDGAFEKALRHLVVRLEAWPGRK